MRKALWSQKAPLSWFSGLWQSAVRASSLWLWTSGVLGEPGAVVGSGSACSPSRRVSTKRSPSVFGTSPRPGAACLAASSLTYHRHVDSVILMRAGKLRLREARELVGGEAEAASETRVAEARVCALGCRTGTRAPMPSRWGEAGEGQARALGRILASSLPFCWFLLSFRRGRSGHEQKWGLGCRRQDGVFKAANRNS